MSPQDSEQQRRSLLDAGAFRQLVTGVKEYAIVVFDLQGMVASWNAGAQRITGYSDSDILGEHFSRFYSPEDRSWGKPQQELKIAAEQGSCEDEGWRVRKDGTRFWGVVLITAIKDDDGKLIGFSKIMRDITERRAAEQSLRDNEVRLRTIVDSAVDGIITISATGTIESVNPAVERIFDYAADELIGQNIKKLMPSPYHDEHDGYLDNYRKSGVRKIIGIGREVLGRRRDGSIFPIDLAVSEVKLGDRRIFTGIVRNITERKRSEQSVRDSEARHRAIFETAVDGIVTIDERGTIESINPATERLFGYTSEELIGRNINMLMPDPYRAEHDGYLENYRKTAKRKIIGIGREVIGRRKDGTTFPMDLAVSELYIGGRRMYTGLIHDVTDRKHAEQQRDQLLSSERAARAEAERANKAKDEFLAVLSHELRTPLTPVLLTTSMLEADPSIDASLKEEIRSIRRSVELEARLIDDLLDLTRVATRRLQLQLELADLHDLTRNAIEICRRDNGVVLTQEMAAPQHHARVDTARFQQVIWNLLINAYKFTPAGGSISIRTSNPDEKLIRIEVADTGGGIDPELIPRLFRPFEQGDSTTARRLGGLGLGLAISKAIVDGIGGSISAQSQGKGKGATFTVHVPAVPAPPRSPVRVIPPPAGEASPTRSLLVLLVEDHLPTLHVMKKLLLMLGEEVITAATVREAIAVSQEHEVDLLISDLGLPDGSGYDVMRHVHAQGRIPGIAVSGYGMAEDIRKSTEAGFSAHLTKPVDVQQLTDAITQARNRVANS